MTTQTRLLRRTEVERFCQIGRSTIYRLMRERLFRVPIRVGALAVTTAIPPEPAWPASARLPGFDNKKPERGGTS
ncbi:MAG: AlpA family phage regulatory protein [Acidobacteria bacterium]|nr:AlpA family phage regulatory protein [Acidobacteriota bacterium]